VNPLLCGGALRCEDLPDGGECPPGTMLHPDCPGGQPGCRPICPPPSPFCAPRPAGCGATIDCACLQPVCEPLGAGCVSASGRSVSCANI
jgi:hypothetical protein